MKKSITTRFLSSAVVVLTLAMAANPVMASEEAGPREEVKEMRQMMIAEVKESLFQLNEFIRAIQAERKELLATIKAIQKGEYDDMDDHDDGGHHSMTVEADEPIPTVDLIVHEDPKAGYNLEIVTENYQFAPWDASTEHVSGEGHSHLYVDGVKLTRVYGNWFYLGALPAGVHEIRIELSANNHSAYTHEGVIIDDAEIIVVN